LLALALMILEPCWVHARESLDHPILDPLTCLNIIAHVEVEPAESTLLLVQALEHVFVNVVVLTPQQRL
jgi:hypothetical protein